MKLFSFVEFAKWEATVPIVAFWGLLLPWCQGYAREWKKIDIPEAVCGDGAPFSVFLSLKDPQRLTIEFQGGGACWNKGTCTEPIALTNLHPIQDVPKQAGGIDSDNPAESPVASESMLFIPYCTGDVFAGTHVAHYGSAVVHHEGSLNVEKSLRYVNGLNLIPLQGIQSLTLYGASAGAIGAMLHSGKIEPYLAPGTRKYLLADAPGLHWGNSFWNRFSNEFKTDVALALFPYQMILNVHDGNLAQQLPQFCHALPDWKIAFLQGDRDYIMSTIFGSISPSAHSKLVYGEKGLAAMTRDPFDNCSSWIARTQTHTFLLKNQSAGMKAGGKTAFDFVSEVLADRGGENSSDK